MYVCKFVHIRLLSSRWDIVFTPRSSLPYIPVHVSNDGVSSGMYACLIRSQCCRQKNQTGHMKILWTRPQIWGPEFGPPETISYVPEGRILTPKLGFTFWVIFRVQRCSFRFGPPALPINARRTIMYHGHRRVCKCGYMYSKPSGGQFTMTWLRCPKLQQTSGHSGEVALMCIRCMHAFTKSTLHV